MGSDSDAPVMQAAVDALKEFGISSEMTVASAHRSPARVMRLVDEAPGRGVKIFIVGAGAAAHLGGRRRRAHDPAGDRRADRFVGAEGPRRAARRPVQMPPGVPVATMAIGKPGATNAGVLAAQILGVGDQAMAQKLDEHTEEARREGRGRRRQAERLNAPTASAFARSAPCEPVTVPT
mgnify:CR=1 FL=1